MLFAYTLFLLFIPRVAEPETAKLRGEIRLVESWRPDINVLGHNVLQYLYEYALDRNELVLAWRYRVCGLTIPPWN